jgi:NhaP-type Na+/H+ or K+/H+ antiporter
MVSTVDLAPTLMLAALVVFAIRPGVLGVLLLRARVSWEAHAFISWFGPRGLNSLLLALLVVQADVPGAELLLAVVGVVVLASVAIHGASSATVSAWYSKHAREETLVEERESTAAGLFTRYEGDIPRMAPEELDEALNSPNPPIVLDVRSRSSYDADGAQIPHSVRVLPDYVTEWAANEPIDRLVVAYCT